MQIKAIENFAHAPSLRSFQIGKVYEVTDKSADEFIKGGLAEAVKVEEKQPDESKAKKTKGE